MEAVVEVVRDPVGPGRGTAKSPGTGRQNVVRPRLSFLLVGQLEKMTERDDKMPSVLVLELEGRPASGMTTSPTI